MVDDALNPASAGPSEASFLRMDKSPAISSLGLGPDVGKNLISIISRHSGFGQPISAVAGVTASYQMNFFDLIYYLMETSGSSFTPPVMHFSSCPSVRLAV
jgi:hypothetical protein